VALRTGLTRTLDPSPPQHRRQRGGGENYAGMIDDFAVWNRALSAADIQTLYLTGPTSVPLPMVPTSWAAP